MRKTTELRNELFPAWSVKPDHPRIPEETHQELVRMISALMAGCLRPREGVQGPDGADHE